MGKNKNKNKSKAPAASTAAKTEGPEMHTPTIKTIETAEAAREKGIGDLPDISAKIPVGLKKESAVDKNSKAPEPGKKKWYAVVKGFPLADPIQKIRFAPGVPQPSVMTRWIRAQKDAGLLVEIDPLDTDPKLVVETPKEDSETTD